MKTPWTDEFTKHKEMKESPVTFMATFKGLAHKPSLIDESLSESFGKPFEETFLVFDEPCRIIGSKYIFETKTLLMVVRSDNRFNTYAMSFKDFEEGGVIVDIVLVVPMNPERAQTICQRQREGLLSVFLVFQVEDYTAEKGSMGSRSQFEYFRFEVTPRILSISFE